MNSKGIIFYDGVCGLCNRFVQFVLKRDPKGIFRFISLQTPLAGELLRPFGESPEKLETVFFLSSDKRLFRASGAVLRVVGSLGIQWKWVLIFLIIPSFLRDGFYYWFVQFRYKLFGRFDSCPIPTPEVRKRFLLDAQEL